MIVYFLQKKQENLCDLSLKVIYTKFSNYKLRDFNLFWSDNERFIHKKVVLAYSGGLDTSVILKWLQTHYNCEVITFTADIGQGEDITQVKKQSRIAWCEAYFY